MDLKIFPILSTNSKRSVLRSRKNMRRRKTYNPRIDLLKRLSEDLGMSINEARNQLIKEREFLLKIRSAK